MCKVFIDKVDDNLQAKVLEALDWIGWEKIIRPDSRVVIKPNFTYPTYKPGVTTSPQLLEALIIALKKRCSDITIAETDGGYYAWKAEEAFRNHGLYELKKKYDIKIVNLYDSKAETVQVKNGSKAYDIPLPGILLKDTDVFISVPVLKVHSMTKFTFGLKNQWGCILDPFRMRYHHVFKEAILKINEYLSPRIMLCDPYYLLTDSGPMDGKVVPFDTLIASNNIFAFEQIGCKVLGVNLEDVDYLSYAQSFGHIPSWESIETNLSVESFCTCQYNVKHNAKDRFTRNVFNSSFLTHLLYCSGFGVSLHQIYYSLIGKKVKIGKRI